ncbi:hypothetical protein CBR_g38835 [Chara braunii]|uniref:Uncharacterized protein n=1 Tax=Chara braunii TaxID=69332 RepID=A0A388LQQ4_CHABU|nr:hypothetical protein CBR_g38835 [Chara braunii]|eukprot:GBG84553.1 hypothetical protein CBR_g38835 [Chara braunii]
MAPHDGLGKGRRDEGWKGRGYVPKSKRQRAPHGRGGRAVRRQFPGDESSRHRGGTRLGSGRDGINREQLAALQNSTAAGGGGASPRTPRSKGIVIVDTTIWTLETSCRCSPGVRERRPRSAITAAVTSGRDKAPVVQPQHRQHETPQQQGAMGVPTSPPTVAGVEGTTTRKTAAQFQASYSTVAEGGRRRGLTTGVATMGEEKEAERATTMNRSVGGGRPVIRTAIWRRNRSRGWIARRFGKPLQKAVVDCEDYYIAIANGDAGVEPPRPCSSCRPTICCASR